MSKRFSHAIALVLVLSLAGGAWADMIGRWTFDNPANLGADRSGRGNNGTVEGDATFSSDSRIGSGALLLDGTDDYIRVGLGKDNMLTNWTKNLTIAAWAKPEDLTRQWNCFFGHTTQNNGVKFEFRTNVFRFTTLGVMDYETATTAVGGEWSHVAVTLNEAGNLVIFYLNGQEAGRVTGGSPATPATGNYNIGYGGYSAAEQFQGLLDDVRIYDEVLSDVQIQAIMPGDAGISLDPSPSDGTTDVLRDTPLGWTAGEFAATHDVYLGTSFDDVNDATATDPKGVLVSQGQADAAYVSDSPLEYGQTYYWRVDEVNDAPDYTVFKGSVWSFTVEPYAYPITSVTAEASAAQPASPAERTIDGSGLDDLDQHGTDMKTMWISPAGFPVWIQYTFDKVYKLHEMWVWNGNSELEPLMGFGAKDVVVEYSGDGETWTPLENLIELAKGTALATYTANNIIDLGGAMAKSVRLTINDNWGTSAMVSISEVRFFYVPVQAFEPQPQVGVAGVRVETDLTWRPGREATSHVVYLGTDSNAVADGVVAGETVTERVYTPADLMFATEYFWKVDEVGDTGTYAGDVWSFTTEEFAVVDDFESYTDNMDAEEAVFQTWTDGYDDDTNGSIVGIDPAVNGTFCETTIVHGGEQSMPLFYDNSGQATYAETKRTFDGAQDWTARGIKSLALYFNGAAGNTGQLYVKINNTKVAYDGLATDIAEAMWLPWNIDLSKVGNVGSGNSLTSGGEGAGAAGTLYIDDIRLYPQTPAYVVPTQPDTANLVAQYTFDGNLNDSAGSHHGTALGNAAVGTDPTRGQVLSLDGAGDAVDVAYSADLNPEAFTASFWAYPDAAGTSHRSPLTARDDSPQRGYIFYIEPGNAWQFWTGSGAGWNATTGPAAKLGEWTHVAATFGNEQRKLYINGRLVGEGTAPLSLNTQRPLRIGGGATEGAGNYFFPGKIDEVRVYNRVLTPEEVAGLAGQTTPLPASF